MEKHTPFDSSEELDLFGLGEDFLDMMHMSQYVDPFALPYQEMDIDTGLPMGPYPELDCSSSQTFGIFENSAAFLDAYEPTDGANTMDVDFSMFYDNTSQSQDQIAPQSPSNSQQISPPENPGSLIPRTDPAKKRKFEDGLSEFVGVKNPGRKRRQRKSFAPDRRKEVDQVRKVGACLRCRITKTRVSSTLRVIRTQISDLFPFLV